MISFFFYQFLAPLRKRNTPYVDLLPKHVCDPNDDASLYGKSHSPAQLLADHCVFSRKFPKPWNKPESEHMNDWAMHEIQGI
jgi:hypothetical protein